MQVEGKYPFAGGGKIVTDYADEYQEVIAAVEAVNAIACLTKISREKSRQLEALEVELLQDDGPVDGVKPRKQKSRKSPLIFSPPALNKELKAKLYPLGWAKTTKKGYGEYQVRLERAKHPRTMDGIKNKVGLEIQFAKYAFMAYDILSKTVIFKKRKLIDVSIEVVVMKSLWDEMSSGPGYFEQIVADLKARGTTSLDIPTMVLGIALTTKEVAEMTEMREAFKAEHAERKEADKKPKRRK